VPNVKPQARGDERRRRLTEAASELFSRGGARGTGIAAVAEQAGVTGATLLHHFGSKERLLQAVLEARDARELPRWEAVVEPGGLEAIRRLPLVAASWEDDPGVARLHAVLLAESIEHDAAMHDYFARRQSRLRRSLQRAIEVGQQRGEIRADVDARLTAMEVACFLDGAVLQWQLDPGRVPLRELFEHHASRLVDALAVDPGATA
jgi:AcrR family transcriptional regulator